jgi:hypothetical protein
MRMAHGARLDDSYQNLNVQVEAALAQGLSFKDKFRTSTRRRATGSDGDDDADAPLADLVEDRSGPEEGDGAAGER